VAIDRQRYVVVLSIPAAEFQRLYAGAANTVVARDQLTGRTVRFPAGRLRSFVTHDGVQGRFELLVGPDNRLLELRRH
jgi:hypothetical protein